MNKYLFVLFLLTGCSSLPEYGNEWKDCNVSYVMSCGREVCLDYDIVSPHARDNPGSLYDPEPDMDIIYNNE